MCGMKQKFKTEDRKKVVVSTNLYDAISICISKHGLTKIFEPSLFFVFTASSKMKSFILNDYFNDMMIFLVPHWFDTHAIA